MPCSIVRRRTPCFLGCLCLAATHLINAADAQTPVVRRDLTAEAAAQEVERSIRIVEARIEETSQAVAGLAGRAEEPRRELDELIDRLAVLQPKKDDSPPPAKPGVKQVEGRVPMMRLSNKRETIAFMLENNRITFFDINKATESMFKQIEAEVAPGKMTYQGTHIVPFGHFDLKYELSIVIGQLIGDIELVRKAGHPGETKEEFDGPNSEVRRMIETTNPETHSIQFAVYPDSFELFRHVRAAAAKREFETGFMPVESGSLVSVGSGRARVN